MQITTEDFQRYLRIVLHWLSGMLVTYASVKPDAAWLTLASGIALEVGTFMWTLYGNRIQAKVNEVANLKKPDGEKLVQGMRVTSASVADAAPANVTSTPGAQA